MKKLAFCAFAITPLLQDADGSVEPLRRIYEAADTPDARIAALGEIAARDLPGHPSAVVAEAVAVGLRDDSYAVRKRAVELLGAGMHAETAVLSLVRAASVQAREEREMRESIDRMMEESKEFQEVLRGKFSLKELEGSAERFQEDAAHWRRFTGIYETRAALVAALSGLRDDRSVEALGQLLVHTIGEQGPIVDALLLLGSLDAVRHVVRCMTACAKELCDAERDLKKLEREEPAKRPTVDDGGEWQRQENARAAKIEAQAKRTAQLQMRGMELRDKLAAFAAARGLPEVPKEPFRASKWPFWVKEAEATLPARLGKIGSTANN
jgi:hypothetical protein